MKKIFLILSIIFSIGTYANAASWPETDPGSQNFVHTLGVWDRRDTLPATPYYLFSDYVAGYSSSHNLYDRIIFLCNSATATTNGACATAGASTTLTGTSSILLQFTEKRSLVKRDLELIGYKTQRYNPENAAVCPEPNRPLHSFISACDNATTGRPNGTTLTMYIQAGEINKLPFGGIWEATLVLNVKRYGTGTIYGKYTVNITVDLTDKGNIQVWLPGFHSDPRVDLNLRPEGNGRFIGSNSLDMCFYDGYSTNSNSMEIKFQDDNPTSTDEYNLQKTGDTTKKLPYSVALLLGGKEFKPVNGLSFTITDSKVLETNWNRITAVAMPEINVPVLCWPARLLLNASVSNPDAGQYSGNIKITFTPSSENL